MRLLQQIGNLPSGPVATYIGNWIKHLASKLPRPWETAKIWDWRGRCRLCGQEKQSEK